MVECDYDETIRTIIFTGRPLRIKKNDYVLDWEENRQDEIRELTGKGILPAAWQQEKDEKDGVELDFNETMDRINPMLMGQAAGAITEVLPAKDIMEEMMATCVQVMTSAASQVTVTATANL